MPRSGVNMPRPGVNDREGGQRQVVDGWAEEQPDGSLTWMGAVPSSRAQAEYLGEDYARLNNPAEPRMRMANIQGRSAWVPIEDNPGEERGPRGGKRRPGGRPRPAGAHAGHKQGNEPGHVVHPTWPADSDPRADSAYMNAVLESHGDWKEKYLGPLQPGQRRPSFAEREWTMTRAERERAMKIDVANAGMLELVAYLRAHEEQFEEQERLQGRNR